MPANYRIEKVTGSEEWEGQFGPMISYNIVLENVGDAQLNQKPSTPAPEPGQVIFGDIQPSKGGFPPRLKKAQTDFRPAAGPGPAQNGGPSPDEREKRIVRQHSQEMAIRFLDAKGTDEFGFLEVQKLTDAFEADAFGQTSPASPSPSQGERSGEGGSAVPSAGPPPDQISTEDVDYLRNRIADMKLPGGDVIAKLSEFGISKLADLDEAKAEKFTEWLNSKEVPF